MNRVGCFPSRAALAAIGAVLVACGSGAPASKRAAPTPVTPVTAVPAPTPPPRTPTAEPLPQPVQPRQGAVVWALYFAIAPPGAAGLRDAMARLAELGIQTGPGHLGCDEGAPEAFKLPPEYEAVALYFASEDAAKRFAARMRPPLAGIARVTIGCPD